mmetsp:Transcript_23496/g.55317  ORF Transcript_23496/g.55317 Transcript_23496/m.55317 type:complete len:347 (+) Transcript_23496:83-1123(+)
MYNKTNRGLVVTTVGPLSLGSSSFQNFNYCWDCLPGCVRSCMRPQSTFLHVRIAVAVVAAAAARSEGIDPTRERLGVLLFCHEHGVRAGINDLAVPLHQSKESLVGHDVPVGGTSQLVYCQLVDLVIPREWVDHVPVRDGSVPADLAELGLAGDRLHCFGGLVDDTALHLVGVQVRFGPLVGVVTEFVRGRKTGPGVQFVATIGLVVANRHHVDLSVDGPHFGGGVDSVDRPHTVDGGCVQGGLLRGTDRISLVRVPNQIEHGGHESIGLEDVGSVPDIVVDLFRGSRVAPVGVGQHEGFRGLLVDHGNRRGGGFRTRGLGRGSITDHQGNGTDGSSGGTLRVIGI